MTYAAIATASFNPPLRAWKVSGNRRVMVIGYHVMWSEMSAVSTIEYHCFYNDVGGDLGRLVRIPDWDIKFMQGFWPALKLSPWEEYGEDPQVPEGGEIPITEDPSPE